MQPLVFVPYLRPMVWGGRGLAERLHKPLPDGGTWGESWEVSVHPLHPSRVAEGPLAGRTLAELCHSHAAELYGPGAAARPFPLLLKYLDACDWLSVQVHPDDARAPLLAGEPLGKTEAWVVLDVRPGGRIFAGLKAGVDRAAFERALRARCVAECLHSFEPLPGDCVFIPAGTVHAVGGGVLLAEVQQNSDATLRLYDWDRLGIDGQPRRLHIDESLAAIDWERGPVDPQGGETPPLPGVRGERLVACPYFCLDRFRFSEVFDSPYRGRLSLWMVVDGELQLLGDDFRRSFRRGETVLVPAAAGDVRWQAAAPATLLGVTLPG